jgi:hypothetical protein
MKIILAKGYFISDLNVNYQYKNIILGAVENILIQHGTKRNLHWTGIKMRPESVEEIHFTQERLSSWRKNYLSFKYHIKVVVYLFGSLAFS